MKWSSCGGPVNLIDRNRTQLQQATVDIEKWKSGVGLEVGHRGGKVNVFGEEETRAALEDAWLVVEVSSISLDILSRAYLPQCVPESFHLKRNIVEMLDGLAASDAIVASNSSSYTITEIMEDVSLKDPTRCVSLHSCGFLIFPCRESTVIMPLTAERLAA